MTKLLTEIPPPAASGAEVAQHDRRRPGRKAANPVLVPLLRGQPAADDPPPATTGPVGPVEQCAADLVYLPDHSDNDGNAARGIIIGVLLSVPLWAIIAGVCYAIFRLAVRS